jgi:uncharacterized protein YPO0396
LVRKIAVRPESAFYAWLDAELAARFNYACCDTLEQFRREPLAVTRAGQTKGRRERHEKDDRHRIDDHSRYVLGWSNEQKIAALKREQQQLETRRQPQLARIGKLSHQRDAAQERRTKFAELAVFDSFRELDWRPLVTEIERLERERRELEEGSDISPNTSTAAWRARRRHEGDGRQARIRQKRSGASGTTPRTGARSAG